MGEASPYMVPYGSYVRIPILTESRGCQKICQCSKTGTIENCQPMPCVPSDNCWLGTEKIGKINTNCNFIFLSTSAFAPLILQLLIGINY